MMQKASACRLGTPCTPRTFKQLLACRTQHHPTLDLETIADRAHVRKDRLYAYANDNDGNANIPHVVLVRLCAVIANWDLIDFSLEAHARRTVGLERSDSRSLVSEMLDTTVAVGKLAETVQTAAGDGVITEDEHRQVRERLRRLRSELDDVESALEASAGAAQPLRRVQ